MATTTPSLSISASYTLICTPFLSGRGYPDARRIDQWVLDSPTVSRERVLRGSASPAPQLQLVALMAPKPAGIGESEDTIGGKG